MLTGITLCHALRGVLEDISAAIQLMELAENLGRAVTLVQGEGLWKVVREDPSG